MPSYFKLFIAGVLTGALIVLGFLVYQSLDESKASSLPEKRSDDNTPVLTVAADTSTIAEPSQENIETSIIESRRNAITRAVELASPAVVGINVTQVKEYRYRSPFQNDPFFKQFFPDKIYRKPVQNLGSGFIISPDGYIISNQHVVEGAVEIIITMADGTQRDAQIIGTDPLTDIALLKIDGKDLPNLDWSDSDKIIIGEWAIAIGNPFGLFSNNAHPTVTVGVISALDRDFQRNREGKLYMNMIQTDAAINFGNSGGPLLDSMGKVIGMNTMIFSESGGSIGLGFAIPSNKIQDVVKVLQENGEINRNYWIGLSIQDVNLQIAPALGLPEAKGVVITDIDPGSPSETAGLKITDVITSLDGYEIIDKTTVQNVLSNEDLRVGDTLEMGISREGKEMKVKIKLEPLPK